MIVTTWHGESETLWYAVNDEAPEPDQPAILATLSSNPTDPRQMTIPEIEKELQAIEMFRYTRTYRLEPEFKARVDRRYDRLYRRRDQVQHNIAPMILDDATREKHEYERMSRDQVMKRYPNIVAHIICESLGYSTPAHAAWLLQRAILGDPDWCEWVATCYKCNPVTPVTDAMRDNRRHCHHGYMASFKLARALVQEVIEGQGEPLLASWF